MSNQNPYSAIARAFSLTSRTYKAVPFTEEFWIVAVQRLDYAEAVAIKVETGYTSEAHATAGAVGDARYVVHYTKLDTFLRAVLALPNMVRAAASVR